MRPVHALFVVAALLTVLVCCAGCTSQNPTPSATSAPPAPQGTASGQPAAAAPAAAATAEKSAGVDTLVPVHFNDYACIDVQKEMGVEYLYPDQKYTIEARPPSGAGVNVNVLLLDVNDNLKIRVIRPSWDAVKKSWVYEGLVPLLQFNDLSSVQQKTVTIKNQGKYYLCVDDRKESGVSDALYQVPVKFTRAG